jgi:hypothetical protein
VRVGRVMRVCAFVLGLTVFAVGCSGGSTETAPAGQPSGAQSTNTPTAEQSSATAETGSTVPAPISKSGLRGTRSASDVRART